MKTILLAASAVGLLLVAGGASAQMPFIGSAPYSATTPGWYGAVDIGGHEALGIDWNPVAGASAITGNQRLHEKTTDNVDVFVRGGYRLNSYIRLELEGGYRPARTKGLSANTGGQTEVCNLNGSEFTYEEVRDPFASEVTYAYYPGVCVRPPGYVDAYTGMANLLVDLLPHYRLSPFIGGGVGFDYLHVHVGNAYIAGPGFANTPTYGELGFAVNSKTVQLAYQAVGGLTYAVTDRLNVDLTYRYLTGPKYQFVPGYDARYRDESLSLGLRYSFAAPPAPPAPSPATPPPPPRPPLPPPPAPPPAPTYAPRDYVIYFPFDQYVVTPEAQNVLQDAAQHATEGHATKEVVVGHTDTSGSAAYNLRLSERRAKATADALVSLGIGQQGLDVSWTGKADLAVSTADGIREPLNRRSTIHLEF